MRHNSGVAELPGATVDLGRTTRCGFPEAIFAEGKSPDAQATWNAVCLADFGDGGIAFVAQPQIPPRNVNWSSSGKWVHAAKIGFEKYFLHKVRTGKSETSYERLALHLLGIEKLKAIEVEPADDAA